MKKSIYNSFLFGLGGGIIVLTIAFFILLFANKSVIGYTERSVFDFLSYLTDYEEGRTQIIPKLLSLSALADLLLFFIFIWTDNLKSARGVIASAFLLGIIIVLLKYIL